MNKNIVTRNGEVELLRFVFMSFSVLYLIIKELGLSIDLFSGAVLGCDVFFIISGYYLALKTEGAEYVKGRLGHETQLFIIRKLRIFMPYFACGILFSVAANCACGKANLVSLHAHYSDILSDLLLLNMTGTGTSAVSSFTWYFSAMIIVCAVLYPLLIKNRDIVLNYICPAGVILIYGYLIKSQGRISVGEDWQGIIYLGILRASAGIDLGCIVLSVSKLIMKLKTSGLGNAIFALQEIFLYICVIACLTFKYDETQEFFYILVFALAFAITQSGRSSLSKKFDRSLFRFLGRLSVPLIVSYKTAALVVERINELTNFRPASDSIYLILTFSISLLLSVICLLLTDLIILSINKRRERKSIQPD